MNKTFSLTALFFLILFSFSSASAQEGRTLSFLNGYYIRSMAETYDGAMLIAAEDLYSLDSPCYIVKYSLEGQVLFKKRLSRCLNIIMVTVTPDSGFVASLAIYSDPKAILSDSAFNDSLLDVALVKFNKCGELEWGKYFKSPFMNTSGNVVADDEGNIYLCAQALNGYGNSIKGVTIGKFNKYGSLINYASFPGLKGYLWPNKSFIHGDVFLSQGLYPKQHRADSISYLSELLQKLDVNLNLKDQTLLGYSDKKSSYGSQYIIHSTQLITATCIFDLEAKFPERPMFSRLDSALNVIGKPVIDSSNVWGTEPFFMTEYGDSIITSNYVYGSSRMAGYCDLRLYNKDFNLLKTVSLKVNKKEAPAGFLHLKDNRIIAGYVRDYALTGQPDLCTLYLFDRNLNYLHWPTSSRQYDWACNAVTTDTIDVSKVVEKVPYQIDSTPPDWQWLWSSIPDPGNRPDPKENKIEAWPQPLHSGETLHIKVQNAISAGTPIQVWCFNSTGKVVAKTAGAPDARGEWHVSNLSLDAGVYLLQFRGINSTDISGALKIIVQ